MDNENTTWRTICGELQKHVYRVVLTVLVAASTLYMVVLGSLAAQGTGPFKLVRGFGNIPSLMTCLIPANFYHWVLALKFASLLFIAVYAIIMVVQRVMRQPHTRHNGAMPSIFLLVLVVSLNLDVSWLFVEDHLNASGSLILVLILFFSNTIALIYSAYHFSVCAKTLYEDSVIDFWMGVGVMNCMALYVTWSIVQFLISLSILVTYETNMKKHDVCSGELIVLQLLFIVWFIFENSTLTYIFNTIFVHYLIMMWYLITLFIRHAGESNQILQNLYISNLVTAVVFLALRLIFLYRRNKGNRLYRVSTPTTITIEDSPAP